MLPIVASLLLMAEGVALPFPAPYVGPLGSDTKFAAGQVAAIDPAGKFITVNTVLGPLRVVVEPSSRIVSVNGKLSTLAAALKPGYYARVYFAVREGARLEELDVLPGAGR
jgi:hypothetical protein